MVLEQELQGVQHASLVSGEVDRVDGYALTLEDQLVDGFLGTGGVDASHFIPNTLMGKSMKEVETFLAAREDELGIKDYEAILALEEAKKKPRARVMKGLKALIGEE